MPYKDPEKKRAHNKRWAHSEAAGDTPLCRAALAALRTYGRPMSRAEILDAMGQTTTPNTLSVTLNRLKSAGRVRVSGRTAAALWEIARG